MSDEINILETHKGVGIHDAQSRDRIENIVKPAIDEVFAMTDTDELLRFCGDTTRPPEARMFAGAKLEAGHQIAAAERRVRPDVDLDFVRAVVAGLNSRGWRSPSHYGSLLDYPRSGTVARTPEDRQAVEDDQRRLRDEERAAR